MGKTLLLLISVMLQVVSIAQDQLGIGQWRTHLPYNSTVSAAESNQELFFATKASIFALNKSDNSLTKYSSTEGLTGYGISVIEYYAQEDILIVGYSNGNIDFFSDRFVYNLPDIANKSMTGSKRINKITIHSDTAYLACDFGLVVVDITKKEIFNTYFIGKEGSHAQVSHVEIYQDKIYALTEDGLKFASKNALNLADYSFWQTENFEQDSLQIESIVRWNDQLVISINDTIKILSDTILSMYYTDTAYIKVNDLFVNDNKLSILQNLSVSADNGSNRRIQIFDELGNQESIGFSSFSIPVDVLTSSNGNVYVADEFVGACLISDNQRSVIRPNGPSSEDAYDFYYADNTLYVASGGVTSIWDFQYNNRGVYTFSGTNWWSIKIDNVPGFLDVLSIVKDPVSGHLYIGSYGGGLVEYSQSEVIYHYKDTIYSNQNGLLQAVGTTSMSGTVGHETSYRITGLAFDTYNDLWITGYGSSKPLSVKSHDGKWYSYSPDFNLGANYVSQILVDKADQKWIISPRGMGIVVFNDGGTLETEADDQWVLLNSNANSGNLPSSDVYDFAIDSDGEIWVCTLDGLVVFYCPEQVFNGGCNAQKISIEKDGYLGYAFEYQLVTSIAIDGANRKWIGTDNGVYLMSEDGTQELIHFNEDNSPLLSNRINDIGINHSSGEVYFATDRGIIGYKSTATKTEENTSFLIYPNPVRPEYTGSIAIRGLSDNSDVKITDIGGNIVFHTIALGGQVVWDANLASGQRVASGIYLVWASNADGSETSVSKLVIMK